MTLLFAKSETRETTVRNAICPGCGCVCDDLQLSFRDGQLQQVAPACALGEQWFRQRCVPVDSVCEIRNASAGYSEAVAAAAAILQQSDYPLIYGLSRSATPGQRAAVELAEFLGAAIDTTASLCHGPSIMALQEFGEVTSTLGEIRNRADLVIFWGCSPATSHPRHSERYSVCCSGRFTPAGRQSRKVVLIGNADEIQQWQIDNQGTIPDLVIPVPAGGDFEVLGDLRLALLDPESLAGKPLLQQLDQLIHAARYGVVFFGLDLAGNSLWGGSRTVLAGRQNVGALLQWVADLNSITRFTARRMRLQGDVSGADNVLCWQTGYPFSVDFSRGYPRYNPGEYSANELLERGDVDACVLIGAETIPFFSESARRHLRSIPVILLDSPGCDPQGFLPTVRFTTAVYGIHAAGTIYRMDNIPFSLQSILPTDLPDDREVLTDLRRLLSPAFESDGITVHC